MTGLVITGWSELIPPVDPAADAAGLFDEPLPAARAAALVDFDVRAHLGRKGTSFYDRATALAVVACAAALRDSGIVVDEVGSARVGVVLGTTVGSFKSTSDFSRETLVQDKPYLVNPVLFPNTVMNCAAGQAAIRLGLRGVNATIAGGRLAMHQTLRYAVNALSRSTTEVLLVGAAEEFSPHRAWNGYRSGTDVGEGAAIFVVERADAPRHASPPVAALLGVASGFGWREAAPAALAGCVRRALAAAEVEPSMVDLVATSAAGSGPDSEYAVAVDVLGRSPEHLAVGQLLGECDAATGALGLAALLHRLRAEPTAVAVLTARTPDGGAAAAVLRGVP
ncbi:beta-ketoacyl synthase N-terminal-like domain-containing protein [Luedemannella helvata]|uniref:Beta-ketoacyl synthase N-terminal-like domain-containing protein n=1 Tax=Luedemannella helvata TaxID=349315 RepID=A0ABP4WZY5_9ACTN